MNGDSTPPAARTRLGHELSAAVTANSLQLQCCEQCGAVQYPHREVCRACLADDLTWRAVDAAGTVLASSALHHCLEPWFKTRSPWLMGSVKLAAGPVVLAHLAPDVAPAGSPAWVLGVEDASGQAVLVALSQSLTLEQAGTHAQALLASNPKETT